MKLTHTIGGHAQLIDLQKLIPVIERYVRQFEAAANILVNTRCAMTDERTLEIIRKMADPTGKAAEKKSGGANRAQERVNRIQELFAGGQPGADTKECKETGWGIYQAGNHYWTHEKGTRGEDEGAQRFKALLPGGPANKEIVRAWDVCVDGLGIKDQMDLIAAAN